VKGWSLLEVPHSTIGWLRDWRTVDSQGAMQDSPLPSKPPDTSHKFESLYGASCQQSWGEEKSEDGIGAVS